MLAKLKNGKSGCCTWHSMFASTNTMRCPAEKNFPLFRCLSHLNHQPTIDDHRHKSICLLENRPPTNSLSITLKLRVLRPPLSESCRSLAGVLPESCQSLAGVLSESLTRFRKDAYGQDFNSIEFYSRGSTFEQCKLLKIFSEDF